MLFTAPASFIQLFILLISHTSAFLFMKALARFSTESTDSVNPATHFHLIHFLQVSSSQTTEEKKLQFHLLLYYYFFCYLVPPSSEIFLRPPLCSCYVCITSKGDKMPAELQRLPPELTSELTRYQMSVVFHILTPPLFFPRKFHFAGNGGKSWQRSDWLGEINGCLLWLRAESLWRLTHSLMVK